MSSLAASRADGFYHPPDWDPAKHGGRDKFQKSKGKDQYEQKGLIRFELMYHSWCEGCQRTLGRGSRFNASKRKAGKYFTTQIWEFVMKCPTCPQCFVIRTDPKNVDYEFVSGIKRNAHQTVGGHTEETAARDAAPHLTSAATRERLDTDHLYKIEHEVDDKHRSKATKCQLTALTEQQERTSRDDYGMNRRLRKRLRGAKHQTARLEREGRAKGLPFALLPASALDVRGAASVAFARNNFERERKRRRTKIMAGSIFAKDKASKEGKRRWGRPRTTEGRKTSTGTALIVRAGGGKKGCRSKRKNPAVVLSKAKQAVRRRMQSLRAGIAAGVNPRNLHTENGR